ncbi:MAG: hypothetical protein J7J02_06480 [Sulfurovum sp.]|nr:hypothetical protein [Sulfurovum sp.]
MLESWSKSEKINARKLFDRAREREYKVLMDERYDYRYSRLIYVFAQLAHAGYLSLEELEVLKEDKVDTIKRLVNGDRYE